MYIKRDVYTQKNIGEERIYKNILEERVHTNYSYVWHDSYSREESIPTKRLKR